MKTLLSLLTAALSGLAPGADTGAVPEGIAASDWSGIRAAHEAARHAAQREADGDLVARNPGQKWSAEFDGKGFTVTPEHGGWTWGLELAGYGDRRLSSSSPLRHEGGKITSMRDENLTEWFINDSRGLEQGWDTRQRPGRAAAAAPLQLHLTTRGNVRPEVSADGSSVSFQQESGDGALSYGGLKAWDADGKTLAVRFESAEGTGFRIAVDDRSARYPITVDPVAQQAYLKSDNTVAYAGVGTSVAISGDTAVVGSTLESTGGEVYVFIRSGTTWTQQARLNASNAEFGDSFGRAVAISGDTIIVGAPSEDSAATGVNGDQNNNNGNLAGAAYVFVRSGTTWSQQAYLKASNTEYIATSYPFGDVFGSAVAISGDTVVVGAPYESSNATGVNGNQSNNSVAEAGAAYVFTRSGTTWSQQAYLKASNTGSTYDDFGRSVAVSGDTVIVGADGEDSRATGVNGNQANNDYPEAGAAYVFTRSGTTWSQQAYLKASDTPSNARFGRSIVISGDTAAIGSTVKSYVFIRNGTTWTQQALLNAGGGSLALAGDKLVVGVPDDSSNATGLDGSGTGPAMNSGAAYLFTRNGTTWTQQTYIKASNAGAGDGFGSAVGISGDTVIVGAPGENSAISGINSSQSPIYRYLTVAGAAYIIAPPATAIRAIPATPSGLTGGGTHTFPTFLLGDSVEITVGLYHYGSTDLVLTGTPAVAVTGSSAFTVTEQPGQQTLPPNGSTTFKVRFTPTVSGVQSATFSIPSNDPAQNPLTFQLVGRGLSYTDDSDGDGLNDVSEFKMTALNFDWQVSQPALTGAYLADVNHMQLYTPAQLQALHPGKPLFAKDPVSGRVKVTTQWEKATNLTEFSDFPAAAGSAVSINPSGKIEFEFDSPDQAAFFRIK